MLQTLISLLPTTANTGSGPHRRKYGADNPAQTAPQEEQGNWIWIQQPEPDQNYYLFARKSFRLTSKPVEAILKTSADSSYQLYVNGHYVGRGPVRSGAGYSYFDTYNIAEFLQKGSNVIAFLVHYLGVNTYSYAIGSPGLICKADITLRKQSVSISTDGTWKVRQALDHTDAGARMNEMLGFQEVYDSGLRLDNWNQPKLSERTWENAVIVGTPPDMPWGELIEREIPQLSEKIIPPARIVGLYNASERSKDVLIADVAEMMSDTGLSALKAGNVNNVEALLSGEGSVEVKTPRGDRGVGILIDFGKEVSGSLEIGVEDSASGYIDIGYSEVLRKDHIDSYRNDAKYADRLILKKGSFDWQSFDPRAFRYVQLEFRRCSKPVILKYVRVNEILYPAKITSSFECSDDVLNNIWKAGVNTARLSMQDTFLDGPWRERAQWWGDARMLSRVAHYAFDDVKLLIQGLRQIAASQDANGMIRSMYPAGEEKIYLDFALAWVFSLLDYYGFTNDEELLREMYPTVKKLLHWFQQHMSDDGLLLNVPGKLFIDWAEFENVGESAAVNCLYHQALHVAGVIASLVGEQDNAQELVDAAAKLRLAINKFLYSPKHGLYAERRVDGKLVETYTRQTNVLAALSDVPDHYQKASIYRQALNGSLPEIVTPYFYAQLLEALYAGDRHEDAMSLLRKKWGPMVKDGADTLWEDFDCEGGLCHAWSAAPVRDLMAEFLGIKPVLGSNRFAISPHAAGLQWAKGSVNTHAGPLQVEWRVVRNSFTIDIEVPEGLKVDVYSPGGPDCSVMMDGRVWPSRFATLGAGTHKIRVTAPKHGRHDLEDVFTCKATSHVEVLDDIYAFGRHRATLSLRRKSRSRRSEKLVTAGGIDVEESLEISGLEPEPELIVAEDIEKGPEVTETTAAAEQIGTTKRKRSRRGGRRRSKAVVSEAETEAVETQTSEVAEAVEVTEAEATTPEQTAETAEAPERKPRRRSRRGGRRRSKLVKTITETAEVAAEAAPVEQEVLPEALATEPVVEAGSDASTAGETPERKPRRRSRRGGHRRSRTTVELEQAPLEKTETAVVEETAPAHTVPAVQVETPVAEESVRSETCLL